MQQSSLRTLVNIGLLAAAFTTVAVATGLAGVETVHGQDNPATPAFYTARVKPIFDASCARCHGGLNHRGGLNMDTRASLLAGGHHGPSVVPGDPDKSLLIKLIRHEGPADDPMDMPPHADKLSPDQIAIISAWVKAGALMPPAPAAASGVN